MPKMQSEERRKALLKLLSGTNRAVTGTELAEKTNVSRQVIVQDIALLRAAGHPITATPQGYLYQAYLGEQSTSGQPFRRIIACRHGQEETEVELNTLVDHGLHVIDVLVEHPIYGEIRGPLMLKNRRDVQHFMQKINQTRANLLSYLTDGIHLHTVEALSTEAIDEACQMLEDMGILLADKN